MIYFIVGIGICKVSWNILIEELCIEALVPTILMMMNVIFNPLACMLFSNG
jgi:hypothetical protein